MLLGLANVTRAKNPQGAMRKGDDSALLVRVVPKEALGSTMIVNEKTGVVMIMAFGTVLFEDKGQ